MARLEDRSVQQADRGARRGKTEAEEKARSWHAEDPLASLADLPSDKVAYLADVKKRQTENHEVAAGESQPAAAEVPAEAASNPLPEITTAAEAASVSAAPEFSVLET